MFMFQTLKFLPAHILFFEGEILGVLAFGVAGAAWMLIPFYKIKEKPEKKISLMRGIGIFAVIFIIIMTILGYIL
jgi:heme/copper-type cytochrome/quinol oxidase subunit 4